MPMVDHDYIGDLSDDDIDAARVHGEGAVARGIRSTASRKTKDTAKFEVTRTWENLQESADGTITGAVEGMLEAGKRKR